MFCSSQLFSWEWRLNLRWIWWRCEALVALIMFLHISSFYWDVNASRYQCNSDCRKLIRYWSKLYVLAILGGCLGAIEIHFPSLIMFLLTKWSDAFSTSVLLNRRQVTRSVWDQVKAVAFNLIKVCLVGRYRLSAPIRF